MNIAVIGAKGLPPKQGGIEHCCAELYPRMVAQGHTVDLFGRCSYTDFSPFEQYDHQGVRVISLPGTGQRGIDALITSALGTIVSNRTNYDVIHFHALGPALFTFLPKLASSSKIIVTCHGLDWQRDKWGKLSSSIIRLGEKAAVQFADSIIVVSKQLQSYFWDTYGRETIYIPNAPAKYADLASTFTYSASLGLTQKRYIVFLGRLVHEKCPDLLIEAFQTLQPEGWKLVFVGGDSHSTSFMTELHEKSSSNPNILFTGELRGKQLAEIVRGAGLFVLPSTVEGMPLAMLEAMQEGLPVLASDIPPHRQLLSDERGLLFNVGDLSNLVKQMDWAINHPQAIEKMAENAQKYMTSSYDWSGITAKTLNVYEQVCNPVTEHLSETLEDVLSK